jgi:uncharacterized protein DUF6920
MAPIAYVGVVAAALAAGALFALGRRRAELRAQLARLSESAHRASSPLRHGDAVPLAVARYLDFALGQNREPPRLVSLTQHGVLRANVTSPKWRRFQATHTAAPTANGFVWNAEVMLAPGVHLRVVDSLLDGAGAGQVLLQSAWPVARESGASELNAGALHRFLAESVWYPWALLPDEHLSWSAIDDHRAVATLSVEGTSVSLEFRFGTSGEITAIYTPHRWRRVDGRYVATAWEGHFSTYLEDSGIALPHQAEVGWYVDNALELVWQGKVDGFQRQY